MYILCLVSVSYAFFCSSPIYLHMHRLVYITRYLSQVKCTRLHVCVCMCDLGAAFSLYVRYSIRVFVIYILFSVPNWSIQRQVGYSCPINVPMCMHASGSFIYSELVHGGKSAIHAQQIHVKARLAGTDDRRASLTTNY